MGDSVCTDALEMDRDEGKGMAGLNSSDNSSLPDNCLNKSDVTPTTSNVQGMCTGSITNNINILPTKTAPDIFPTVAESDEVKGVVSSDPVSGTECEHTVPVACGDSDSPKTENNHVASINCSNSEKTESENAAQITAKGAESSVTKSEHVSSVTDNSSETSVAESKHETSVAYKSNEANTSLATDYEFDGECYCYTDKESGITYKFDNAKQEWVVKETQQNRDTVSGAGNGSEDEDDDIDEDGNKKRSRFVKQDMSAGVYSFEGDTHVYTDPSDGTKYMWDREKNAWFPKIDEDFLARYQMSYGFLGDNTKDAEPEEQKKEDNTEDKVELKRKAPAQPTWFEIDEEHNNKVYVNNLPEDITEQEFVDIMQKCGLIMKDPDTGKLKIKLYTIPGSDKLKGDGLCTYIRIESVDLALKVLDGYELRGHKMSVERAKFQMKGDYNPTLKPKKRRKKDKEKIKKIQEKLLDWRPDMLRGERPKHERVVVVKNLFEPSLFENNVPLILEYQQDLREECSKFGVVRKVVIHDRHAEGVAQIFFSDPEEADICVKFLNGRWYSQRQLKAETWDGKTKYRIVETEEQAKERLAKWASFLEKGEGN